MPAGFHLLIAAQFISALADNALLIVAVALLQEQGHPAWWAPLLKFSLTIAYVLLAPLVGPLADGFVKARVMMAMNALKVLGVFMAAGRRATRCWPSSSSASAQPPMRPPSTGS